MAIEALGTPVVVSVLRTMASTFSRSAAEIGAGAWACTSDAVSKTKIKTAGRLPDRGSRFINHSSEPEQYTALGWHSDGQRVVIAHPRVAVAAGSCRALLGLDGRGAR